MAVKRWAPRTLDTDAQRGEGTFEKSIIALERLNSAGYGSGDPSRVLTLMVNPVGALLTVWLIDQAELRASDHGGVGQTAALSAGSPAIDYGSDCSSHDQRGMPRVGPCDSGAYEYQP